MKITFATEQLEDWYAGTYEGRQPLNEVVLLAYRRTVNRLSVMPTIADVRRSKSLNFHSLKKDPLGKYGVRVNM